MRTSRTFGRLMLRPLLTSSTSGSCVLRRRRFVPRGSKTTEHVKAALVATNDLRGLDPPRSRIVRRVVDTSYVYGSAAGSGPVDRVCRGEQEPRRPDGRGKG